jgi:hypothetical protein
VLHRILLSRSTDPQQFGTLIVVEAGRLSLTSLHCLASHSNDQLATSLMLPDTGGPPKN